MLIALADFGFSVKTVKYSAFYVVFFFPWLSLPRLQGILGAVPLRPPTLLFPELHLRIRLLSRITMMSKFALCPIIAVELQLSFPYIFPFLLRDEVHYFAHCHPRSHWCRL